MVPHGGRTKQILSRKRPNLSKQAILALGVVVLGGLAQEMGFLALFSLLDGCKGIIPLPPGRNAFRLGVNYTPTFFPPGNWSGRKETARIAGVVRIDKRNHKSPTKSFRSPAARREEYLNSRKGEGRDKTRPSRERVYYGLGLMEPSCMPKGSPSLPYGANGGRGISPSSASTGTSDSAIFSISSRGRLDSISILTSPTYQVSRFPSV